MIQHNDLSTMTKDEVINLMDTIDNEINVLKQQKREIGNFVIENFCPFKVGQKAKYIRRNSKNVGTFFEPKWENTTKEETLVCVRIQMSDWSNRNFSVQLKRIKPDGTLTANDVHVPKDELEWLDEFYDFSKKD